MLKIYAAAFDNLYENLSLLCKSNQENSFNASQEIFIQPHHFVESLKNLRTIWWGTAGISRKEFLRIHFRIHVWESSKKHSERNYIEQEQTEW